jgi:hypothetical protein
MYSRRRWIAGLGAAAAALLAEAALIEPRWLRINHYRRPSRLGCRLVHISDLHFHGDDRFLETIVKNVNDQRPDVVCFSGDLVDEASRLDAALQGVRSIAAPVFGVPGNHDYWSGASFSRMRKAFQETGGDWLLDEAAFACNGALRISGLSGMALAPHIAAQPRKAASGRHILLCHYPAVVKDLLALPEQTRPEMDLILTGHSHGGQVRLPFIGALLLPFGVEGFVRGWYDTPAGPLYVNVGLGTTALPFRFLCRPEIAVFDV